MSVVAALEGLTIELEVSGVPIIEEVTLDLAAGEVLALVGETASGKTTAATALLAYQRRGAVVSKGAIKVDGIDLRSVSNVQLRKMRGAIVSYVPQDPGAALNPALKIGTQLTEILAAHDYDETHRPTRLREMLEEVSLPSDAKFLRRYPHQISGGQQQRILLAMSFACRPKVIVLDEPTTGLDVTTQARVLTTISELTRIHRAAAIYVTHDLSVVANIADRIAVMYGGRVVEVGTRKQIFRESRHPYTSRLISASPSLFGNPVLRGIPGQAPRPGDRPEGCVFSDRCEFVVAQCTEKMPEASEVQPRHQTRCWRWSELGDLEVSTQRRSTQAKPVPQRGSRLRAESLVAFHGATEVLHGVNIEVSAGECLAVVGESGSGKTTLARCLAGLHGGRIEGHVTFGDARLERSARRRPTGIRRAIQYVFQNPYGSLHPRKQVRQILLQPLNVLFELNRNDRELRLREVLSQVSLDESILQFYAEQLSGGERQRVAIARALAASPSMLICDEITSALDVSVQASIVQLLTELKRDMGLGLIFVTHNLALVRSIAETVSVLRDGVVVESGPTERLLSEPTDRYTERLLSDSPTIPKSLSSRSAAPP